MYNSLNLLHTINFVERVLDEGYRGANVTIVNAHFLSDFLESFCEVVSCPDYPKRAIKVLEYS